MYNEKKCCEHENRSQICGEKYMEEKKKINRISEFIYFFIRLFRPFAATIKSIAV